MNGLQIFCIAQRSNDVAQAFGKGLVKVVPKLLTGLSGVGTAAMLWVGGGIIVHGLEEMHIAEVVPHTLHDWAVAIGHSTGTLGPAVEWLVNALGGALAGLIVGGIIAAVLHFSPLRKVEHGVEQIP